MRFTPASKEPEEARILPSASVVAANATGETMTEAVRTAIQDRLKRVEAQRRGGRSLADRLDDIARHAASLPVRRRRSENDILGYDERGLPKRW